MLLFVIPLFPAFLAADVVHTLHWSYAALFSPLIAVCSIATLAVFVVGIFLLLNNIKGFRESRGIAEERMKLRRADHDRMYAGFGSSAYGDDALAIAVETARRLGFQNDVTVQ